MSIPATDIAAGLRVAAQLPLDAKAFFQTEAQLIDLGTANNLAFTYYKWMTVQVFDSGRRFTWEEVDQNDDSGLMDTNFQYPAGHTAGGIDYSNKYYNWIEQTTLVAPIARPYIILKKTGNVKDFLEEKDVVLGFLSSNQIIMAIYEGGPITAAGSFTIMDEWAPDNY